ncbi:hypothetical protein BDR06DRAFT_1001218 [Suillus hirtellus]|nr:hypothetical protein BDR06DRAFT_1001218 [Suillus hirtellus]
MATSWSLTYFGITLQWSPHTPTYPSPSSTATLYHGQAYSLGPYISHYENTLETSHTGSLQFTLASALTLAPTPFTPTSASFTPAPAPLTSAPTSFTSTSAPFTPTPTLFTPAPASFTLAPTPLTPAPFTSAPTSFTPAPAPFTPAPAPAPAPSHTVSYNTSPQFHLPSLPTPKYSLNNHNANNNIFNQNISRPFDAPLGDYFEDDDMMVDKMTNSPSCAAGRKWQLPSLPLPPPNTLKPFHRPAKSPVSSNNNCLVFGLQKLLNHGGQCK